MAQTKDGAIKSAAKLLCISEDEYRHHLSVGEKWCRKCKCWQPRTAFGKDAHRGDGLSTSCLESLRVKECKSTKGRTTWMKGKHHSPLSKWLQHLSKLGSKGHPFPHTGEARRKMSATRRASPNVQRGAKHYAWKGGITVMKFGERRTPEYKQWRHDVYERDHYTCQECGDKRGGNLHAHHIKAWADYPELRYALDNGVTLCNKCHRKKHSKHTEENGNGNRY